MDIFEKLSTRAQIFLQHIVLFEGEESRTLQAAHLIEKRKLADVTLLGDAVRIAAELKTLGIRLDSAQYLDPASSPKAGGVCWLSLPASPGQGYDRGAGDASNYRSRACSPR